MCWLKRDIQKVGIIATGILIFLILLLGISLPIVSAREVVGGAVTPTPTTLLATPTVDLTVTVLAKAKLEDDVKQGKHTFENWFWTNGAALLSILVLVVGALIGFLRWLAEQRNASRLAQQVAETEYQKVREAAKIEFQIAQDNHSETALQTYIDKMSELLLENNLRRSQPGDEVREIARVRTLTILPQLDSTRKKSVLRFLYESDLILTHNTIVDLSFADLRNASLYRATLNGINLSKSNLHGAYLNESELDQANLSGAKLKEANLIHASLVGANLSGASLQDASLIKANLAGADLRDADLQNTKLSGVRGLTKEQLEDYIARGAVIAEITTPILPQSPD